MSNDYDDVKKIRNLMEALHMFALYDISVKELNKLIKSSSTVGGLAHKIIMYGDEDD